MLSSLERTFRGRMGAAMAALVLTGVAVDDDAASLVLDGTLG